MATHSRILAWKIPWTEEPGRYINGITKSRTMTEELNFKYEVNIYGSVQL